MKITVPLKNGCLPDRYTKHASRQEKIDGEPVISFPITIEGVPKDTKSLAITLLDDDAIPVCGFTYIHWVAANLDPDIKNVPENASQSGKVNMTLGHNSLAGGLINNKKKQLNEHYVGPTPPDQPHNYKLSVYALDKKLPLNDGFWLNELKQQMNHHILNKENVLLPVKN